MSRRRWGTDSTSRCRDSVRFHTGFEIDDKREQGAYERMGIGWRDTVLPRLAQAVPQID
ncbi:hypothetical protein GCM10027068_03740 [Prescottella soli]